MSSSGRGGPEEEEVSRPGHVRPPAPLMSLPTSPPAATVTSPSLVLLPPSSFFPPTSLPQSSHSHSSSHACSQSIRQSPERQISSAETTSPATSATPATSMPRAIKLPHHVGELGRALTDSTKGHGRGSNGIHEASVRPQVRAVEATGVAAPVTWSMFQCGISVYETPRLLSIRQWHGEGNISQGPPLPLKTSTSQQVDPEEDPYDEDVRAVFDDTSEEEDDDEDEDESTAPVAEAPAPNPPINQADYLNMQMRHYQEAPSTYTTVTARSSSGWRPGC